MSGFYTGKFSSSFKSSSRCSGSRGSRGSSGKKTKSAAKVCKINCENTAKGMIRPSGSLASAAISVAKANMYNQQCQKACDKKQ